MADLTLRTLHAGPLLRIYDVACRAGDPGRGPEEASEQDEIVFCRSGGFLRERGRERDLADANHVLFFARGGAYRVSHPIGGADAATVLAVPRHLIAEAFGNPLGVPWNAPARGSLNDPGGALGDAPWDAPMSNAWTGAHPFPIGACPVSSSAALRLHALRRRLRTQPPDPLAAEEAALETLRAVAEEVRRRLGRPAAGHRLETRRRRREIVARARALLVRDLRHAPALGELAREAGASPYHLARLFRAETGMPMRRYRLALRLKEALERLDGGARDLTSVALECGFASHSHFSDAFRAAFGLRPSDLRDGAAADLRRQTRTFLEA